MVPSESMGNKYSRVKCSTHAHCTPCRSEAHTTVAETLRSSEYYRNLDPLLIDDISPMNTNDTQPIIFEQRYLRQAQLSLTIEKTYPTLTLNLNFQYFLLFNVNLPNPHPNPHI